MKKVRTLLSASNWTNTSGTALEAQKLFGWCLGEELWKAFLDERYQVIYLGWFQWSMVWDADSMDLGEGLSALK